MHWVLLVMQFNIKVFIGVLAHSPRGILKLLNHILDRVANTSQTAVKITNKTFIIICPNKMYITTVGLSECDVILKE